LKPWPQLNARLSPRHCALGTLAKPYFDGRAPCARSVAGWSRRVRQWIVGCGRGTRCRAGAPHGSRRVTASFETRYQAPHHDEQRSTHIVGVIVQQAVVVSALAPTRLRAVHPYREPPGHVATMAAEEHHGVAIFGACLNRARTRQQARSEAPVAKITVVRRGVESGCTFVRTTVISLHRATFRTSHER